MAWNGVSNMRWNGIFVMAWNGVFIRHGMVLPLQKELNLYVDKNGTVWDLLQEAANEVCLV